MFNTDENIKSTNGILDSPIDVNIVESILYINRNGNPTKYTRRYNTASSNISAGVCNMLIIECEKQKPNTPSSTLKTRKLISDVDTIVFILLYSLAPK